MSTGTPTTGGDQDEIVLGLLTTWISEHGDGTLLAPPVVEVVGRRGPVERGVVDFGLDRHLPVAGGL